MDYRHHTAQSSKPQAPLSPSNWSALYEVSARQSWAQYSSRPKTDSRHQGWTIKDFSVLSEMCSIWEQPLYGIMLMISHTNKWCVLISDQNLQYFSKSIWKIPSASGQSYRPFTSCRTCLSWQWILTGPKRVEWLWVNDFSHNEYHIWKAWPSTGYGSMTLATTNTIYGKRDPALVDMWGTGYQNMKYQSSLRRRVITWGSVRVRGRVRKFYL